ncbi:MAG: hypothetical protein ACW98X_24850 [Promethearchaeota archaeon]|jgi:hypothetical protein
MWKFFKYDAKMGESKWARPLGIIILIGVVICILCKVSSGWAWCSWLLTVILY